MPDEWISLGALCPEKIAFVLFVDCFVRVEGSLLCHREKQFCLFHLRFYLLSMKNFSSLYPFVLA
jgi:hypothetical protein